MKPVIGGKKPERGIASDLLSGIAAPEELSMLIEEALSRVPGMTPGTRARVQESKPREFSSKDIENMINASETFGLTPEAIDSAIRAKYEPKEARMHALRESLDEVGPMLDLRYAQPLVTALGGRDLKVPGPEDKRLAEAQALAEQMGQIEAEKMGAMKDVFKTATNVIPRGQVMMATDLQQQLPRAPGGGGSEFSKRINPETEANQLSKNLRPQDKAAFYNSVRRIKDRIGSLDPEDSSPIAGTNLSAIDRMNPFSKNYDQAKQTFSDLSKLVQSYQKAISGVAVSEQEARRIMETAGLSLTNMSPGVIRNFIKGLTEEVRQDVEFNFSGVSPEALTIYKKRNLFGGRPITKDIFDELLTPGKTSSKPQQKIFEAQPKSTQAPKKKSLEMFK